MFVTLNVQMYIVPFQLLADEDSDVNRCSENWKERDGGGGGGGGGRQFYWRSPNGVKCHRLPGSLA